MKNNIKASILCLYIGLVIYLFQSIASNNFNPAQWEFEKFVLIPIAFCLIMAGCMLVFDFED
jgi:hypothetical protein